jgi:hypothetical protein
MDNTKGLAMILATALALPHSPVWGQRTQTVRELGAMVSSATPVELGTEPVTLRVAMRGDTRTLIENAIAPASPTKLAVTVEGVEYDTPDVHYEVYIDLPNNIEPSYKSPYFVGNLAPFLPRAAEHETPFTVKFDISRNVRELKSLGVWNDAELLVTFVMRGLVDRNGRQLPVHPGARGRIGNLTIAAITPQ